MGTSILQIDELKEIDVQLEYELTNDRVKQIWRVITNNYEIIVLYKKWYLEIYSTIIIPNIFIGTCMVGFDVETITNKVLKKVLLRDKILFQSNIKIRA